MLNIDTLRQLPLFAKLPDSRLQWLIEGSEEIWLNPGDIHRAEGAPAEHVFVLLEGQVRVTQKVENQDMLLAVYEAKTLFGELPVLTGLTHFWAGGRAATRCQILEIPNAVFWQLLSSCHEVMVEIIRTMAQHFQSAQTISQQREKLVALGTLAAGLAHELNNPAAAARRAASRLKETWNTLQPTTLQLCESFALADLQKSAIERATNAPKLDPLTQSDREEEIAEYLESLDIPNCWKLAPTLVAAGLDIEWLNQTLAPMPKQALPQILNWLDTTLNSMSLLNELENSTNRISTLVQAVKDYSYLDQAPLQEIDIHDGLESTLTILSSKLKQDISIERNYDRNAPRIIAYGSELNQVWTNLIDNAIDAIQNNNNPTIWIRTCHDSDHVFVEIIDNGSGIPPEIQSHIFEPFFTTKSVGKGTGLGLHIAYRIIVEQHKGNLHLTSEPGKTCFQVCLPIQTNPSN